MSTGPSMEWLPPTFQDLLWPSGHYYDPGNGRMREAYGTGIITLLGSARSAKTSLAYAIIDTVIRETSRPVSFIGFPDEVMKAMPSHWNGRIFNPKDFEKMLEFKGALVLCDDTAVSLNARDSMTTESKFMARLAGIISHRDLTLILTTQSMSGIDLSLTRMTQLAVGIRRMSPGTLKGERANWLHEVIDAQEELKMYSKDQNLRDVFYSLYDEMICKAWFPSWLDKKNRPKEADMLSKPFGYMSLKELKDRVLRPPRSQKKKKKGEDENEQSKTARI